MIVLGIESSCDETAVAIVKDGNNVLSSVISSQVAKHAPYGGVIPEIAAREHLNAIGPLFNQAIKEADIDPSQIDLIATTQGPGLVGALLVGSTFAKGLGVSLGVPVLPVDHVHAHVHGALLGLPESVGSASDLFPALSLVVSGGHTNLYWMESPVQFRLLAATVDDACGECFDKVARMWNLPYPGGPVIEKMAKDLNILRVKGYAAVEGKPMRLLVQAVGARVRHQFDRPWGPSEPRRGQLVVIAEHDDINADAIRAALVA